MSEENAFNVTTSNEDLVFTVKGVQFVMKKVEGGTFWMGADNGKCIRTYTVKTGLFRKEEREEEYIDTNVRNYDSEAEDDEKPVHSVTISSFFIGETEVTQALWKAVMGSNPSPFLGDNNAINVVSWNDCQQFIGKLNQITGKSFRLPTEAEWEFAARGGNRSKGYKFAGGDDIEAVAICYMNCGEVGIDDDGNFVCGDALTVKTKMPNELGLYDMSGNVWEFCGDWYGRYNREAQTNPTGPARGEYRVMRGGSWDVEVGGCRVQTRGWLSPDAGGDYFGFRLVLP